MGGGNGVKVIAFVCDRKSCANRSADAPNLTEARKSAEAAGWFIRPSDTQPEHVCPSCLESALAFVGEDG
jgi:hypothetical protein